jgi:hypothetical protein
MSSITEAGGGRHRAPEPDDALRIAHLADVERPGRHAESEWQRESYDPARDEDPFDWLGFGNGAA